VGIKVAVEDPLSNTQKHVCRAFSTYVAKPAGDKKVNLKPVKLQIPQDHLEYSLATERRRIRLYHEVSYNNLMEDSGALYDPDWENDHNKISTDCTRVESIELVLPPHANHQGNTFGGQIMAWMETVANISASVEVGVRVEAYNCEEWTEGKPRHINSAFLIYQALDANNQYVTFPRVKASNKDSIRRFCGAIARRKIRVARKYILSSKPEK
ncbi:unnamed protein product, partial [Staurois parvus]